VRRTRGLLPYAALAVLIVAATVVTLVLTTFEAGRRSAASASPTATPVPTAPPRALTDLSPSGRLAYWREEGGYQLWVANADNTRRRAIARAPSGTVSQTRWSARGEEVGYVEDGQRLVIARVDGVTSTYTLAPELRAEGWRITAHAVSPSGARVVATVQRVAGSQTDVFIGAAGGTFTRLTTTEDVVAAEWISEDELLVNTTGGVIARLGMNGTDRLRPLTSLPGASPLVGDDGRVYFLSGRVTSFAAAGAMLIYASSAAVWSMTVDGEDLRRERSLADAESLRLDGFWPGGAYLVHRGTNPAQYVVGPVPVALASTGRVVERARVSSDGYYAIGLAGTNLLRFDLSPAGAVGNAVVLLGDVAQADAWFPRTVTLARATGARAMLPAGTYVFSLGGSLWLMRGDGEPSLLRSATQNAQTLRRFPLPPPVWSPRGDRLLTVESLGTGSSASQLVPVVISPDGAARRFTTTPSVGQTASWSPDGTQFAVVALPAAAQDPVVLRSELEVQLIDATLGTAVRSFGGREAFWTKAGVVVLTNGTLAMGASAREEQSIEVWKEGETRTITTIARLRADARAGIPATAVGATQADGLSASADGAFVGVRLSYAGVSRNPVLAVVRASDGVATVVVGSGEDDVHDEAWGPAATALGYTLITVSGGDRAIVRDAATGDVLLDESGRFAGWSADGAWAFVGRSDGLYARRIAESGGLVRVSPFGVPMSVARS